MAGQRESDHDLSLWVIRHFIGNRSCHRDIHYDLHKDRDHHMKTTGPRNLSLDWLSGGMTWKDAGVISNNHFRFDIGPSQYELKSIYP